MDDAVQPSGDDSSNAENTTPGPLSELQRRILGVLIEKARTTPDSYPLSLNGLVTGCNQKSNRAPVMNVSHDEAEDTLIEMREKGIVAEVHSGGRVPKYRHYAHDYLGVKGVEVGVLAELLLRGEQSVGDLRSRASRFEPIADLGALQTILVSLQERGLVVFLTPAGRGQMVTHNLYEPYELDAIKSHIASGATNATGSPARSGHTGSSQSGSSHSGSGGASSSALAAKVDTLEQELASIQALMQDLQARIEKLES